MNEAENTIEQSAIIDSWRELWGRRASFDHTDPVLLVAGPNSGIEPHPGLAVNGAVLHSADSVARLVERIDTEVAMQIRGADRKRPLVVILDPAMMSCAYLDDLPSATLH